MRPFYLDENQIIRFPRREIYNSSTHEAWFKDEDIPVVGVIRGYFYSDHISVFVNDYDIPPIHPAVIMNWFNSYESLNYVELGASKIETENIPKLVVFRGASVKFNDSTDEVKDDVEPEKVEDVKNKENLETTEETEEGVKEKQPNKDLVKESLKNVKTKKIGF